MKISLAYSPCPNDTFMFHGLAKKIITISGYDLQTNIHDIETLNAFALRHKYDITKLSFFSLLLVSDTYKLLPVGAALGFGCGPVLVAKKPISQEDLVGCTIAVPGELTTANLLLKLYAPRAMNKKYVRYDEVMPSIIKSQADCGVIIHESRFLFKKQGLSMVTDLGSWWEETTGCPIPLGAVAVKKDLPEEFVTRFTQALRQSIIQAQEKPGKTMSYIKKHAKELDPDILNRHIHTFVNEFSLDLGEQGMQAIRCLQEEARKQGIIK